MKIVVQRCLGAKVDIAGETVGSIERGLLLFVCLEKGDTAATAGEAAQKIAKLRIFEDGSGKMNLSLQDTGGHVLSISQFTLSWNGKKGHRPSFDQSMPPKEARLLYSLFNQNLQETGAVVETGRFGADMQVSCVNDGPVTFHLSF